MNKKLTFGLAILATSMIASAAQSAEQVRWPNWYVGLHAGLNFRSDGDLTLTPGATTEIGSDTGLAGGISLGYVPPTTMAFFNNTRWELEFAYRANDNDNVDGDISSLNYYANLYYDFNNDSPWTPYVGAGIGLTNVDYDTLAVNGDDTVLGWQLLAGLSYAPTTLPNTFWSLGYRYQTTFDDPSFTSGASQGEVEVENHGVELGARFAF